MHIVSIYRAQVFQQFSADDVRPEKDYYVPRLYEEVHRKYRPTGASDITKVSSEGAKFQGGRLEFEGREIVIESLEIYEDGIIVKCRSSADGDIVVDDAIEWAIDTFRLRRPRSSAPRQYISWIIADFDSSTSGMFRNFDKLQRLLSDAYAESRGDRFDFETAKLTFAADPTAIPQFKSAEFTFDRRTGAPFAQNRFFCVAPLRTETHVRLLKDLEGLLAG